MIVIIVTIKLHIKVVLKDTLNQNMKVSGILVISVITKQQQKEA